MKLLRGAVLWEKKRREDFNPQRKIKCKRNDDGLRLTVSFVLIFYLWFYQSCSGSCNMKLNYSNQNGLKELPRKIWKTDHRAIVRPLIKQDCLHPRDLWLNSPLLKQLYILISSRSIYFIKSCKTVARSHSLNKSTLQTRDCMSLSSHCTQIMPKYSECCQPSQAMEAESARLVTGCGATWLGSHPSSWFVIRHQFHLPGD